MEYSTPRSTTLAQHHVALSQNSKKYLLPDIPRFLGAQCVLGEVTLRNVVNMNEGQPTNSNLTHARAGSSLQMPSPRRHCFTTRRSAAFRTSSAWSSGSKRADGSYKTCTAGLIPSQASKQMPTTRSQRARKLWSQDSDRRGLVDSSFAPFAHFSPLSLRERKC
jgi:hypothetical protein